MRLLIATALSLVALATPALAQEDRSFVFRNQTSVAITAITASAGSWSRDLIAGRPIAPNKSFTAQVNDGRGGCTYSFTVEWEDGSVAESTNNVCTEAGLNLTE